MEEDGGQGSAYIVLMPQSLGFAAISLGQSVLVHMYPINTGEFQELGLGPPPILFFILMITQAHGFKYHLYF